MTFVTPCSRPENDPDDWFIGRDGKQYPDDELFTTDELLDAVLLDKGGSKEETIVEKSARVARSLEAAAVRAALIRRRHARDKCHVECIVRTQCLGKALELGADHGTWGGYYPEELRQIVLARNEHRARLWKDPVLLEE